MVAAFFSFIISIIPGFLIKTTGSDSNHKIVFDASFDMEQFVRAAIVLFTIISLIFVLYFLFNQPNKNARVLFAATLFIWCSIIAFSFSRTFFTLPLKNKVAWYSEVKKDFKTYSPKLMAMMGNENFSGQTATSMGVQPWYCTGIRADNEGYIFSKKAYERNYIFKEIFNVENSLNHRKNFADSLKSIGIDCIVASPATFQSIRRAEEDSIVTPIKGSKWMYRFN